MRIEMKRMIAYGSALMMLALSQLVPAFHIRDDFDYKSDHWLWIEDGDGSSISVGDGICTLRLENPVVGRYCNAELVNRDEERYRFGVMVVRCKASGMRPGSRGWGWWDRNKLEIYSDFDVAWVMQSDDYSNEKGTNWFRWGHCAGAMEERVSWSLVQAVDPQEWHTYRLEWTPEFVSLTIDDSLFSKSVNQVPDNVMSLDIWVDNQPVGEYGPTFLYYGWEGMSWVLVDYVEVWGGEAAIAENQQVSDHAKPEASAGSITVIGIQGRRRTVTLPRGFVKGVCSGFTIDGRRLFRHEGVRAGETIVLGNKAAQGVSILHFSAANVMAVVRMAM
ncbi:MAG: family 16 glycosylhydrolase [Chitinivibrionales bacterium]|nr:family 16 glycosylhydrolase [Chitinivibrionales bacterium]MBD3358050.1 family 16 glycosylhydrolase [Chitinivibrionales bacterium]